MVSRPNINLLDFRKKEDYEIGPTKGELTIC